ncbi:hypothetical protein SD77_4235 [Bacillus badius]|uniref:Uncharacterized protein n=1 Tax=Bacillus badius TaxID=1455 RepID=A0ABR5AVB9_BACBA|nr:hypothetical protein SD78_0539 [Bacillus badius]KIL78555.1 hypothetical protein SD77_4235 [Bacillus badius]
MNSRTVFLFAERFMHATSAFMHAIPGFMHATADFMRATRTVILAAGLFIHKQPFFSK